MNLPRLVILLALAAAPAGVAQTADFPTPPVGHVLDPGRWLPDEPRRTLEDELLRIRREHDIDVLVILWDHSLPVGVPLDELARRLGEAWAREPFWAVVLHVPYSARHPVIRHGGPIASRIPEDALAEALLRGASRGAKESTPQGRVVSTALEVSEEFIFLLNRRDMVQSSFRAELAARKEKHHARMSRILTLAITAFALGLVLAGALGWYLLHRRRLPPTLEFPDTRWRRRLGAGWSGGRSLLVTIPAKG